MCMHIYSYKYTCNGSGRAILRGKADRMTFRSWMHEVGMVSQKLEWYSHRNSGKSCKSTSNTRRVPEDCQQSVRSSLYDVELTYI